MDKRPEGRESEEKRMDKLRMAEANYKSYTPINGVVEPDFLLNLLSLLTISPSQFH